MKKLLIILMVVAMASFLFVGCFDDTQPDLYTLTMAVNPTGGGTTVPAIGTHPNYTAGTLVSISATPVTGYEFVNWTGDVDAPSSASATVTMDADKAVTANFETIVGPILTVAPIITSVPDVVGGYINAVAAADGIVVNGTAPTLSEVKVYINGLTAGTGDVTATGAWTVDVANADLIKAVKTDGAKVLHATATEVGLPESISSNEVKFTLDTKLPGIKEVKFTALKFAVDGEAEATAASPGTCVNPALIWYPADVVTGTWTVKVVTQVVGIDYEVEITDPDDETTTYAGLLGGNIFSPDSPIPGVGFQLKPALVTVAMGTTISFDDNLLSPDTITTTVLNDFVGVFFPGDVIIVEGSALNDGIYTIATVVQIAAINDLITLIPTDTLVNEVVGANILIKLASELIVGQQSEIVCTAEVEAIDDRATLEFDETITYAAATATTCVYGGVVEDVPSVYKESNNTGYWWGTDMPLVNITAGTNYTITVYGVKDPAGNVGGTEDVPLTKSAIAGAASATLLEP